jgi:hypothetical protein
VFIACRYLPVVRCGDGPRGGSPTGARSLRTQQRAYGRRSLWFSGPRWFSTNQQY